MLENTKRKVFTGSHNPYVTVAQKDHDFMALSVNYQIHPIQNIGFLLVRFIVWSDLESEEIKSSFKHMQPREYAKFKDSEGKEFSGIRLIKVGIPVFFPGPSPMVFIKMCDKFLVWELLADWVIARCKGEGFEIFPEDDLKAISRGMADGSYDASDEHYQFILQMPDFTEEAA